MIFVVLLCQEMSGGSLMTTIRWGGEKKQKELGTRLSSSSIACMPCHPHSSGQPSLVRPRDRERERALSKNWIMNKMRIFFLSMSTQVFQRFINLIRPFFFISFHPRQTDRLQNRGGDWRWFTPLFTPKHCLLSARLFLIGLWSGLLLRSYSSSS